MALDYAGSEPAFRDSVGRSLTPGPGAASGAVSGAVSGGVCFSDPELDLVAAHLTAALEADMCVVSTFTDAWQFFVGAVGLPEPFQHRRRVAAARSFCMYAHRSGGQLVVSDIASEGDLAKHPFGQELGIAAYAGWPIRGDQGNDLGGISVFSATPREWSSRQVLMLADIASSCGPRLEAFLAQHAPAMASELGS